MKNFMKCFFTAAIFLSVGANASDWSLKDSSKGWNSSELVEQYFHNSEMQTQWAWEALSQYSFRGNEKVLDFGSGDGKISSMMSYMVQKGHVMGIDLSESMVRFAKNMFPNKNLHFNHSKDIDFSQTVFPEKFDLITSFCVFHLVPNTEVVLKNLKEHLTASGKFVGTFPIGGNPIFFQAVKEEMDKRGWALPAPTENAKLMRDPVQSRKLFENAGFKLDHYAVVPTKSPFHSKEDFMIWCEGTLSANWNIPKEGRREFFKDLVERYLKYRPDEIGEDGFVYFSLNRIDFMASKV